MHIKGDFLSNMLLNTAFQSGEGLRFYEGEILRGLVEAIKDNGLILINLKGFVIEAQTEVEVQVGQRLLLCVDDFRQGRAYLRILPSDKGAVESHGIAQSLVQIGVKPSVASVEAARKLIQFNLPVTAENIDQVLRGSSLLGSSSPANLEVAAFAMSRGLKVSTPLLFALKDFMSSPRNVAVLLASILPGLRDGLASPFSVSIPVIAGTGESELPGTFPPRPTEEQATVGPELKAAVTTAEGSGEKALLTEARAALEKIVKGLVTLLAVEPKDSAKATAAEIQKVVQNQPEAIRTLVLLEDILNTYLKTGNHTAVKEALTAVQAAQHELSGQRVFNGTEDVNHNSTQPFYYFALPLKVNGQDRLCQLRVYKDTHGKKGCTRAREISLAVSLETARMGVVLFHVTIRQGRLLFLQGVVERESTRVYLERGLTELVRGLQELGYEVTSGGIKTAARSEDTELRPCLSAGPGKVNTWGIDIRV